MKQRLVLLVCNPSQPRAAQTAQQVVDFLHAQGHQSQILTDYRQIASYPQADLCISLGGDGTVLRCARTAAPLGIPVLPINCGHLGFLAACEEEQAISYVTQFLNGTCKMEERWLLQATFSQRDQSEPKQALAFNDCVIKATRPRAFTLQAKKNGVAFKRFYGDGVIVATTTGSTAYSLAAGGPIVEPNLNVWTVTPICPHSLSDRSMLLDGQATLTFTPQFKNQADQAAVSLDGQENFFIHHNEQVTLRRANCQVKLICPSNYDFFERLQNKLEWGKR